jgi:hypothetical protein
VAVIAVMSVAIAAITSVIAVIAAIASMVTRCNNDRRVVSGRRPHHHGWSNIHWCVDRCGGVIHRCGGVIDGRWAIDGDTHDNAYVGPCPNGV